MDEYKLHSTVVSKREIWYGEIVVPVFLSEIECLTIEALAQHDAKELYNLELRLMGEQGNHQWHISINRNYGVASPAEAVSRLAKGYDLVEKRSWEDTAVYATTIAAMTFARDLMQEHIRLQHER